MDTSTAQQLTLTGRFLFHHGLRHGFPQFAKGWFVRVRTGETTYVWDRISDAEIVAPYAWKKKVFNVALRCEALGIVNFTSVSDLAPTMDEVDAARTAITSAPLYELADAIAVSARAAAKTTFEALALQMTVDDCTHAIRTNSQLNVGPANLVAHMSNVSMDKLASPIGVATALTPNGSQQLGLSAVMAPPSPQQAEPGSPLAPPRLDSTPSFSAPLIAAASFTSPMGTQLHMTPQSPGVPPRYSSQHTVIMDDPRTATLINTEAPSFLAQNPAFVAEVQRLVAVNDQFTKYVMNKDRIREQSDLVALTQRNREKNKQQILAAARALERRGDTAEGKLEESGLLWEVNKEKRVQLSLEEDGEKDKKADKTAAAPPSAASSAIAASGSNASADRFRPCDVDCTASSAAIADDIFEVARRSTARMSAGPSQLADSASSPVVPPSASAAAALSHQQHHDFLASPSTPMMTAQQAALHLRQRASSSPANMFSRNSSQVVTVDTVGEKRLRS